MQTRSGASSRQFSARKNWRKLILGGWKNPPVLTTFWATLAFGERFLPFASQRVSIATIESCSSNLYRRGAWEFVRIDISGGPGGKKKFWCVLWPLQSTNLLVPPPPAAPYLQSADPPTAL